MKRIIFYIIVHCTGTQPNAKIEDIQRYWKDHLGWKYSGYHYIIKRNGEIVKLRQENQVANGVKCFNEHAINISYIGGIDKDGKAVDNLTPAQEEALFDKIMELSEKYPEAKIMGHRDFPHVKKDCPSFDVKTWLRHYQPHFGEAS